MTSPQRPGSDTEGTIQIDLSAPAVTKVEAASSPKLGLPPGGIPGYAIGRRLGVGGMGQVYEATRESDGRGVALKLLRADTVADPEFRTRFQREIEVMRQVSHPNVVGIIDAGDHSGYLWLATELMPDGDLDKYLTRRGQLFEKDALGYVVKIARGLVALHAVGVIHRDLKPQNVFLDHKGGAGDVKVGDLGMARHEDGADRMTMTGTACGTPAYMAPEQILGEKDIDARADCYACGVLLFTLLAGREPFIGDTVFTISHAVLKDAPPDLRRFRSDVSATVAAIVRKALTKDRALRYQSAADLVTDCERALRGERPLHAGVVEPAAPAAATPTPVALAGHGPTAYVPSGGGGGGAPEWLGPAVKVLFWAAVVIIPISLIPTCFGNARAGAASSSAGLDGLRYTPGKDEHGAHLLVPAAGVTFAFRWCPPGTMTLGDETNEPGHAPWERQCEVTFTRGRWLLEHEITRRQWAAVRGEDAPEASVAELPITGITLAEAEDFCRRLGEVSAGLHPRLPSEAEWEQGCRLGGATASDPLATTEDLRRMWDSQPSNDVPNLDAMRAAARIAMAAGLGPQPVSRGAQNAAGLRGMTGNVQEWCRDRWNHRDPWPASAAVDPLGATGPLVVVRGGSWLHPSERARAGSRAGADPDVGESWIGFRIVIPAGAYPEVLP